ncbi:MAG: 50S ribosomal protein L15 [Alphaproteobacteria bacterium]|nr:50S ribosomal protein L15 [Alphaproteobacteria bacterium]
MKLNQIRDNKGARKQSMRVSRGVGSGKGRTGGRGFKGQKSRTGVSIKGFEGGQMPVYRRLPKRGFNNAFRLSFVEINLGTIQKAIDANVLDAAQEINGISLMEAGLIKHVKDGVRLLGTGTLTSKVTIRVAGASKAAQAAVEKVGGQLILEPKKATVLEKGIKTSKKEPKKVVKKSK